MRTFLGLGLVSLLACGGRAEPTDATDPVDKPDPWVDDRLIGTGDDVLGADASRIQWFGFGDDDTPLAVVERKDGVRPIGTSLVALTDGGVSLRLDSQSVLDASGSDGIDRVFADDTGRISFTTGDGECWGMLDGSELSTLCRGNLAEEVRTSYLGPMIGGRRPAVLLNADRSGYTVGVFDGALDRWVRASTAENGVGVWALDTDDTLWIGFDDELERLAPEQDRSRAIAVDQILDVSTANPGSAQIRGLLLSPRDEVGFIASAAAQSRALPGSAIYVLTPQGGVREVLSLTDEIVDGERIAMLGTGGQPALAWAFDTAAEGGDVTLSAELTDGSTAIIRKAGSVYDVLARSGDVATDRHGDPLSGVRFNAIGSAVMGPAGRVVFAVILEGEGVEGASRYAVYTAHPSGAVHQLARTGEPLPGSQEAVETIRLHGGRLVFPDPRDEDPARRRTVPDAGGDNDASLVMWGARGWNRSMDSTRGCDSILLGLDGETDSVWVRRQLGDGC